MNDDRREAEALEAPRARYLTDGSKSREPAFTLTAGELGAVVEGAVRRALRDGQAKLVDKATLAKQLGCSAGHIDNLRKLGLPTVALGQAVRFEPEAVIAWLRQHKPGNDS